MKMYILVKDTIPAGIAAVAIAHASLATYLTFKDEPEMVEWLNTSFKKVICRVTPEEFEIALKVRGSIGLTESTLPELNGTVIGFCPRKEYPPEFRRYKLYGATARLRAEEKYLPGMLCVVNGRGDLMMNRDKGRYIDKICRIVKLTKAGLVEVVIVNEVWNGKYLPMSFAQSNISLLENY